MSRYSPGTIRSKALAPMTFHPHADVVVVGRLLDVSIKLAVIPKLDDTEIDLHLSWEHPQGKISVLATMKLHHLTKIQGGQRGRRSSPGSDPWYPAAVPRDRRTERFALPNVIDTQSPLAPVPTHCLDQLGQIAGADRHIDDPACREPGEKDLDNRFVTKRHKRFGEDRGQRDAGAYPFPPARMTALISFMNMFRL